MNLLFLIFYYFSVTDECAAGTDNCDDNAICTNNDVSFTCACKTGYTGSGITCQRKYKLVGAG